MEVGSIHIYCVKMNVGEHADENFLINYLFYKLYIIASYVRLIFLVAVFLGLSGEVRFSGENVFSNLQRRFMINGFKNNYIRIRFIRHFDILLSYFRGPVNFSIFTMYFSHQCIRHTGKFVTFSNPLELSSIVFTSPVYSSSLFY